jgi:ribosomal protein S18 acetylase RimI-like enzyme
MNDQSQAKPAKPIATVEQAFELSVSDLNDLCDATDSAIEAGGGFGWVSLPSREILERYWQGVLTMPLRKLFIARLDGVVCGTGQLVLPSRNNEAQNFAATLTAVFVAPWARGHGLARMLMEKIEKTAVADSYSVINLDVRETQEAAIRLYEKMGYVHFGTHPFYAKVDDKVIKGRYYYKVIDDSAVEQTL